MTDFRVTRWGRTRETISGQEICHALRKLRFLIARSAREQRAWTAMVIGTSKQHGRGCRPTRRTCGARQTSGRDSRYGGPRNTGSFSRYCRTSAARSEGEP